MLNTIIAGFIWMLGLCVGSFLNVVIYRLPLGKSLSNPKRSFCPHCGASIAALDNIPVLSWLMLRGRCRACHAPISPQYPLIEATTGLVFVLTYHLLVTIGASPHFAEFALDHDWPLLLAWLTLVAVMVACSGMDFVSYTVDTRVTNFGVVVGLIALAAWPRPEAVLPTAAPPFAAAMVAATLVGLIWHVITAPRFESNVPQAEPADSLSEVEAPKADVSVATPLSGSAGVGLLGVLAMLGLSIWLISASLNTPADPHETPAPLRDWPTIVSFAALFIAMVVAGSHPREVDLEIAGAIENEGVSARGTAWRELLWLLPSLSAGVLVAFALLRVPALNETWNDLVRWSPIEGFAPVAGATFSLVGVFAGVAAGWFLRIFFTVVFGREAFGIGDIYILAAAGAIGGWQVALLGLLLSVGLATVGWLMSLLFKSTLIIPFGPWLALGFFMALWLERSAGEVATVYRESIEIARRERPEMLWMLAAILLAGMAIAVVFARLARRLVEPHLTTAGPARQENPNPDPPTPIDAPPGERR